MNLTIMGNRILVKPNVIEDQMKVSKGGLILPESQNKHPFTGTVLAVGVGWDVDKPINSFFNVGDTVLFGQYGGTPIDWEDEIVAIFEATDILAIVKRKIVEVMLDPQEKEEE